MKKSHILAIVVIAVAIGIIMTTAGDASTYVTFKKAQEISTQGVDEKVHVVGKLKKDNSGVVQGIEVSDDMLSFSFRLVDSDGKEDKIFYANPMPNDFYKSEQVVVVGQYKNDLFVADNILMKCPSKYQEDQLLSAN